MRGQARSKLTQGDPVCCAFSLFDYFVELLGQPTQPARDSLPHLATEGVAATGPTTPVSCSDSVPGRLGFAARVTAP